MATLHQFTEGFYSGASLPKRSRVDSFFRDSLEELERQITVKIFDANRTLTSLTAEHRRTVEIDGIHTFTFEAALLEKMRGKDTTVNTLSALVKVLPAHSIVRRHPKGDFCVIAPVMMSNKTLSHDYLASLSDSALWTPEFSCEEGELFVPLAISSHSPDFVEVLSPNPGPAPEIVPSHYQTTAIPVANVNLTFPLEKEDDGVELVGIRKGDVGAAAHPGMLNAGDVLLCRGRQYRVKGVTGGGTKHEVFQGRDLIVFDQPFPFNSRKVVAHVCPPILVKAKRGVLPLSALSEHEPIKIKYTEHKQAKRFGCLKITFCNLAFNKYLVCHRDSFV